MQQQKRKKFEGHLKEQQRTREILNQKRKEKEQKQNNPQQDMLFIQKQFRSMNQQMERLIMEHKKGNVSIQTLSDYHLNMKQYYLEINYVLTTYDRQFYKQLLDHLNTTIFQLRKKAEPKKKFCFKRRDEDFGVQTVNITQEEILHSRKQISIPGIENISSKQFSVTNQCPKGGSFKIVNCSEIKVELLEKTEILFLKGLRNCIVKAGITKSTVFVDDCKGCQFELNCHQLRIHNTYDSTFGIYVTSRAIIENCDKILFKPYKFEYADRKNHEEEEHRLLMPNLWRQIQDFNWLKQNQKSPHFSLQE